MKLLEIVKTVKPPKTPTSDDPFKIKIPDGVGEKRENYKPNPNKPHQHELAFSPEERDQLVEEIRKNCTQILNIYRKTQKFLKRGESTHVVGFKNNIRQNRSPIDLDKWIQDYSVKAFDKLGLKANRENSIFCADEGIAQEWGYKTYVIYPVDGFKFTWFENYEDNMGTPYLFVFFQNSPADFIYNKIKDLVKFGPYKERQENIKELRDKLDKDLRNNDPEISKEYVDWMVERLKEFKPNNTNLESGLRRRGTEYLITGTNYYGISVECPELIRRINLP